MTCPSHRSWSECEAWVSVTEIQREPWNRWQLLSGASEDRHESLVV